MRWVWVRRSRRSPSSRTWPNSTASGVRFWWCHPPPHSTTGSRSSPASCPLSRWCPTGATRRSVLPERGGGGGGGGRDRQGYCLDGWCGRRLSYIPPFTFGMKIRCARARFFSLCSLPTTVPMVTDTKALIKCHLGKFSSLCLMPTV